MAAKMAMAAIFMSLYGVSELVAGGEKGEDHEEENILFL